MGSPSANRRRSRSEHDSSAQAPPPQPGKNATLAAQVSVFGDVAGTTDEHSARRYIEDANGDVGSAVLAFLGTTGKGAGTTDSAGCYVAEPLPSSTGISVADLVARDLPGATVASCQNAAAESPGFRTLYSVEVDAALVDVFIAELPPYLRKNPGQSVSVEMINSHVAPNHALRRLRVDAAMRTSTPSMRIRFTPRSSASPSAIAEVAVAVASGVRDAAGGFVSACFPFVNAAAAYPAIGDVLASPGPARAAVPAIPPGMTLQLYPHQRESVACMLHRERSGFNPTAFLQPRQGTDVGVFAVQQFSVVYCGTEQAKRAAAQSLPALRGGVLADEMGLGKTISIIALAALNPMSQAHVAAVVSDSDGSDDGGSDSGEYESRIPIKTTLVLGTVSIVGQWEQEIKRAMPTAVVRKCFTARSANGRETCGKVPTSR